MTTVDYRYGQISGFDMSDTMVLGYRYDQEYDHPDYRESHAVWIHGIQVDAMAGLRADYTGVFYASPGGPVFVSDSSGAVHYHATQDLRDWRMIPVEAALFGVWGIDERFVIAWGARGDEERMFRWNGQSFDRMPAPPGRVRAVHGIAPDLLYAVGPDGMIARWDGSTWTRVPHQRASLESVFVVSPDEIYACGSGGEFLEGSVNGMAEAFVSEHELTGVAKWNGTVYVAANEAGLMTLDGNQLVSIKPNIKAHSLDARRSLMMAANEKIVGTADGKSFKGSPVQGYAKITGGVPPRWLDNATMSDVVDLWQAK